MTFSGRFVLDAILFGAQQGANAKALLALAGLNPEALAIADCRVDAQLYNTVAERVAQQTGDPVFGLHMGESQALTAANVVMQIAQMSRTVREALQYCCEFASLGCRALPMELVEDGPEARLLLTPDPLWGPPTATAVRITVEGVATFTVREFRGITRDAHGIRHIYFAHPKPPTVNQAEYERVLGCPVQFAQPQTALVFDAAYLNRPIVTSNYDLLKVLVAHAQEKVAQLQQKQGAYAVVKRTMLQLMGMGFPTVAQVAANLNLSVRTLQRRLSAEGLAYKEVLEEVRQDFALHYLKQPQLSVGEVAHLLNYAESSAFTRAFKGWTGQTPLQYRSSLKGLSAGNL